MAERKVIVLTGADGNDYDVRDEEAQQSIITMGNEIGSVPSGKTLQGQIDTLSNGIGSVPSGQTVEGQISALESGKVPTTRKVNNKALSSDITLVGTDIPVSSSDSTKVDSALANKVPTTRKVNNKALSSDVNLVGSDIPVSALDSTKLDVAITDLKSAKADKDGTHEDLTAGNALYLLSDRGDTDVAPYVFRKTGGAKNGYGREFLRKIVGGTVAWNQIYTSSGYVTSTESDLTYTKTSDSEWTLNGTASANNTKTIFNASNFVTGHKYLMTGIPATDKFRIGIGLVNYDGKSEFIFVAEEGIGNVQFRHLSGASFTNKSVKVGLFDLTKMFGSTIADALYAMEQATAGSGVAWFRSLFPNSYYAYDAGSLQSVQAKEHRLTGFNQWDEQWETGGISGSTGANTTDANRIRSKNYIHVVPNETYYNYSSETLSIYLFYYDENKNFLRAESSSNRTNQTVTIPSDVHYMRFFAYKSGWTDYANHGEICINLSDSSRNGQYKPYAEHTYPLDSSLILRGIPKWDSTNGMYYDGDEYTADGTVTRKYQTATINGTESYGYSINMTSSNNTVFRIVTGITGINSSNQTSNYGVYRQNAWEADDTRSNTFVMGAEGNLYVQLPTSVASTVEQLKALFTSKPFVIVWPLATPTTEQADRYRELQISAHGGTEEFVDAGVTATTPTRDVSVPVGTETFYPVDIWHLIDELTALVLEN